MNYLEMALANVAQTPVAQTPVVELVAPVLAPVAATAVTFTPYKCDFCKGTGRLTLHKQKCPRCTNGTMLEENVARFQRYLKQKNSGRRMDYSLKSYR
jgi:ribosomal protein S27AE